MKAKTIRFRIAAAVAGLLALAACNDSLDPIFYTIEKEEPLVDAGLPNDIAVFKVVEAGSYYVAAAGKLYYRPSDFSADWARLSLGGTPSGATCIALDSDGTKLYAGFRSSSGGLGVWTTTVATLDPATSTWAPAVEPIGALDDLLVTWIKAMDDGEVFVAARDGATYYLYNVGSATPVITTTTPVNDVTHFPAPANAYYAVAGAQIWSVGDGTPTALFTAGGNPLSITPDHFAGIHYASTLATPRMFVSTGNGYLASTTDGSTWVTSSQVKTEDGNDVVGFTRFGEADDGSDAHLLVGTEQHGYYDLTEGNLSAAADGRKPDYNIADLYNAAVQGLFWDSAPLAQGRLFAFTYGSGLWSSTDLGLEWNRE